MDAWQLFGGEIDWGAVPWTAEMLGVDDLDLHVHLLKTIRDHSRQQSED